MSIHIDPADRRALSVEAVARHCGVSEERIRAWIAAGWLHLCDWPDGNPYPERVDSRELDVLLARGWTPRAAVPVPPPVAEPVDMSREAMAARYEAAAAERRRRAS